MLERFPGQLPGRHKVTSPCNEDQVKGAGVVFPCIVDEWASLTLGSLLACFEFSYLSEENSRLRYQMGELKVTDLRKDSIRLRK